jgi:hypothetical protein
MRWTPTSLVHRPPRPIDVPKAENRAQKVAQLAGAIENLLQKHQRVQHAALLLGSTDTQSLDHSLHQGRYRHARTELTAAVWEFADTIIEEDERS